jgi:hypothetical protein
VCFACRVAYERLNQALSMVLPVSLCPLPGPLYSVLLGYKEAPVAEVRSRHAGTVGDLFTGFLSHHKWCIFELLQGPPSLVLPVPSTSRPGPAPLDRIPGLCGHVRDALEYPFDGPPLWCPEALERSTEPIGHMAAHPGAFEVAPWARPLVARNRIVLLDDTYVSGARAQSAAAALRRAGSSRVLIVPLGRVIRPDTVAEHAELLARSRRSRAAKHRCARCVVRRRQTKAGTE